MICAARRLPLTPLPPATHWFCGKCAAGADSQGGRLRLESVGATQRAHSAERQVRWNHIYGDGPRGDRAGFARISASRQAVDAHRTVTRLRRELRGRIGQDHREALVRFIRAVAESIDETGFRSENRAEPVAIYPTACICQNVRRADSAQLPSTELLSSVWASPRRCPRI